MGPIRNGSPLPHVVLAVVASLGPEKPTQPLMKRLLPLPGSWLDQPGPAGSTETLLVGWAGSIQRPPQTLPPASAPQRVTRAHLVDLVLPACV